MCQTSSPDYTDPDGKYKYAASSWWAAGFFPGAVWLLYERSTLRQSNRDPTPEVLLQAAGNWQVNLAEQALRRDHHDLGFMIQPSFQRDWELTGNRTSRDVVLRAARNLASRFNEAVGCIRSWDTNETKVYNYNDPAKDFLVIVDNMMNLDLLFWGAKETMDEDMFNKAVRHAETTLRDHVRQDYSTFHVVNYDQRTGEIKGRFRNQGFSDDSCWTQGQAWAIYGFATAYKWTGRTDFMEASMKLADYFFERTGNAKIPAWDFDSPQVDLYDVSAAMIAISGCLQLYENNNDLVCYFIKAMKLLDDVLSIALSPRAESADNNGSWETILMHSTVNNADIALNRIADTGVNFADYYFLEIGNRLIRMGLL